MVRKMSGTINSSKDLDQMKKQLASLEARLSQVGAKAPPTMKIIRDLYRKRIAELEKK